MTKERTQLEKDAISAVCTCWYYDLANVLLDLDDVTLHQIVNNPLACHIQEQLDSPIPVDEFIEELKECPNYRDAQATKA